MPKILSFILICFVFAISSCSSCHTPNSSDAGIDAQSDSEPDVNQDRYFIKNDYKILIPASCTENDLNKENLELAFTCPNNVLFLLTKELYALSYDSFAIESIRQLRGEGVSILNTKSLVINETPFVMAESEKDNIRMFLYVTVKNGYGYSLSCGGKSISDDSILLCERVVTSFVLN